MSEPRDLPPRAWQRMLSGRRLDLLDPAARVARWNGQTRGPHVFSVAQHSLLVEAVGRHIAPGCTDPDGLELLLHDAPEYVVGDIISPLKAAIGDAYRGVELRLLAAVRGRFGLDEPAPALGRLVKRADRIAAHIEAVELAGFNPDEAVRYFGDAPDLPGPVLALAQPWPTDQAEARFLDRFHALCQA
jgi:5'-deoxynucleotidase YfbR-like HD superfamily hydrolase